MTSAETASLAAGLALVPLAIAGDLPGHEIEHPMAIVIIGGLVTSTLLNLFVTPSLYLRFGGSRRRGGSGRMWWPDVWWLRLHAPPGSAPVDFTLKPG